MKMKFKTFELKGTYPSDFAPATDVIEIQKHFAAYDWYDGRMLGSKLEYSNNHVDDLVVFNANILMPNIGKVLYADVNLTEDYLILQQIAQSLNTTLYVLWEMDARFGNENKPMDELLGKAVWNTDEEKPTKQWYLNKSKKLTWDKVL
jgi:hypothetical protein